MDSTFQSGVRIPKGINISVSGRSGSEVGKYPLSAIFPWYYLFIHHNKVKTFTANMDRDGITYFIHKSVIYQRKKQSRGVRTLEKPTISGLVFLQGNLRDLQNWLDLVFPNYHLVKDRSTNLPAVIPDSVMQPFMRVLGASPERVRFLLHPFKYYAGGNVKLRITSGFLAGIEGYVIRIDRDRRLIMNVGGMSVAIAGVHCEKFEVVEGEELLPRPVEKKAPERRLTGLQARINRELYIPQTQSDVCLITEVLELWKERALLYQEKWQVTEAREILFFLLEEIDYRYASLLTSKTIDMSPVLKAARGIAMQIDKMVTNPKYTEETREEIAAERDASLSRFGYLFAE